MAPAPCMHVPGLVGEDHLARMRMLGLAGEGGIALAPVRVADGERTAEPVSVDNRYRHCVGERNRITEVHERMNRGQCAFLPVAPQQRLGSAPVLRWLEPHASEGAPPRADLRELSLGGTG